MVVLMIYVTLAVQLNAKGSTLLEEIIVNQREIMRLRLSGVMIRSNYVETRTGTNADNSSGSLFAWRKASITIIEGQRMSGAVQLIAWNPEYAFALIKQPETGTWKMTHVNKDKAYIQNISQELLGDDLDPDARLLGMPLYELLSDGNMLFERVEKQGNMVEVQGHYSGMFQEDGQPAVGFQVNIIAKMDHTNRYALVQARLNYLQSKTTIVVDNKFTGDKLKLGYNPCIKHKRSTIYNSGDSIHREVTFEYPDSVNYPDERARLSFYGLEEPFGITWERPTPWWIYFGLIGGGCLVGFVLIGVFLRRRYGAS